MICSPKNTLLAPTPDVARRALDGTLESWRAVLDGTLDYWTGALGRGDTPLDVAADAGRFWRETTSRRPPRWASRNRVVLESDLVRLRDYSKGDDDVVPTLVFPPQAGHDSCIVDFSAEQSQVKTIRAAGLTKLFTLDWKGATQATKDASIEDYLAFAERAVEHIGGPVNLVGDCQGGWLAAIYAALHPEQVNTLTIAGAPIDFHGGDGVIHDWVRYVSPLDLAFYEGVVAFGDGVMKGEFMLNGFVIIKPENEVAKQFQLLNQIRDEAQLARHRVFEDWFEHTQDIPGAFYLWIVEHLFRDNELMAGTLDVGGRRVDLANIACPLFLLGGATDHITPPDQVFALERHASTPARDVVKRVTSGGHLGLFMGSEALREHWPPIMAEVLERSKPAARPEPARRRAKRVTPRVKTPIPAP
jgi:poly(3-hydroxybutyrate) depolymerase